MSGTGVAHPTVMSACRARSLESRFVDLLARLSPSAEALGEFPKIAARVWEAGQGDAEIRMKKVSVQLGKAKSLKKKLLGAYLEEKIAEDNYQEMNADYTHQISHLERQLREPSSISASTESFISFAELQLSDLSGLWQAANDDQRRRVQTILFRDGLRYSAKSRSLNPDNSAPFSVLQEMNPENLRLASPPGFEPVLPP